MKRLAFLLVNLSALLNAQEERARPNSEGGRGIQFVDASSWQQVLQKAKTENKHIFVDAFATWCVPCIEMDKQVYVNETVGQLMNEKFLSVKVQMDSTGKDNEHVKRWYADARKLEREYRVDGFPSFLFFNPQGRLVYKDIGFRNVPDFIKLAERALDPRNELYFARLEDYQREKTDQEGLGDLAAYARTIGNDSLASRIAVDHVNRSTKEQLLNRNDILLIQDVVRNRKLADSLAKEYKSKVLDKLTEDQLCTKENLDFIGRFYELINSKDKFFKLCYHEPDRVNKTTGGDFNWAGFQVDETITREEMATKLVKDRNPLVKNPKWAKIQSTISKKYAKVDAKRLVLDFQVVFYRYYAKDWTQWAKYLDQRFKAYPVVDPQRAFWDLNLPAWDAFLYCNDEKVLAKALQWSDLSIKLEESRPNYQCLDTRANLLYKLGRVEEAIAQEEKAVEVVLKYKQEGSTNQILLDAVNGYKEVINKMKKGEPTYLEEDAVWDDKSLQRLRRTKAN